jgi:hypothetical protein
MAVYRSIVLLGILLTTACMQFAQATANFSYGLVITIGTYERPDISPLPGTQRDVKSALEIAKRLGFDTSSFVVLRDAVATRERILAEMSRLASVADEGKDVFVYFSGHGARFYDPNLKSCGAEVCCREAYIPSNATLDPASMLTVEDFGAHLNRVAKRARSVFFMVDSCHSAGLVSRSSTRSSSVTSLYVPKTPVALERNNVCQSTVNYSGRASTRSTTRTRPNLFESNVIQVNAASANEVAWTHPEFGGLATSSLLACLNGGAKDLDRSGSISLAELQVCTQENVSKHKLPPTGLPSTVGFKASQRVIFPGLDVEPSDPGQSASGTLLDEQRQQLLASQKRAAEELAAERAEAERLALERQRQEQQRREQVELAQRLEKQRLERERIEADRLAREDERRKQAELAERLEREGRERERAEAESVAREEQRQEQQRQEQAELAQRLEKQRQEQAELAQRLEKQRRDEVELAQRLEKQRRDEVELAQRLEKQRLERERVEADRLAREDERRKQAELAERLEREGRERELVAQKKDRRDEGSELGNRNQSDYEDQLQSVNEREQRIALLIERIAETNDELEALSRLPASNPKLIYEEAAATLTDIYESRDPNLRIEVQGLKATQKIGGDYKFSVRSSNDGFLYVLHLGSDKKTFTLLFPNEQEKFNRIRQGNRFLLPGPNWQMTSEGPPGLTNLLVVVSRSEVDVTRLTKSLASGFSAISTDFPGRKSVIDLFLGSREGGWANRSRYGAELIQIKEFQ